MVIIRPFLNMPRLTALVIALILVAGVAAVLTLPRQEDPVPIARYASVVTFINGASATRVESLITEPLEEAIQEVAEVLEISSVSRTGVSVISVELQENVFATDDVWSQVRSKLSEVEPDLPPSASKPQLDVRLLPAVTLLVALTPAPGADLPIGLLSRLATQLDTRLSNIPGTEESNLFGAPQEEYLITLDPVAAASAGISAGDISRALAQADSKVPAGLLRDAQGSLIVEVAGELTSLERIRRVPVTRAPNGQTLRVGDLARVEKTIQDPPATLALLSGRRGIAIGVTMQQDQRVDQWSAIARERMAAFKATLPDSVVLETIIDQSVYTQGRLLDLSQNFILGVVLVVGILFVLMGWRSAVLVGISLPLSVCAVLGTLAFLDVPLHQMSISGAIIALGLLIDNAIVVVDDYNLLRRRGRKRLDAATAAVKHLQIPLFASTLTTALTFAPIMLMPGGAGDFVGTMALTVILAIFSSLIISLTIVPALAAFADKRQATRSMVNARTGIRLPKLAARYRSALSYAIAKPKRTAALCLILPLIGFVCAGQLDVQFFPPVDRDQFQVQLSLPSASPLEETLAAVERVNVILDRYGDAVTTRHWFLGENPPKAFYNMFLANDGLPSFATGIINTVSEEATARIAPDLQRVVLAQLPEAELLVLPFEQGPPIGAAVEVRVLGDNLADLRQVGEQVRKIMSQSKNVTYTRANVSGGRPKLLLKTDEDAAASAGLTLSDVSAALRNDLEGSVGGSVLEEREELPVRVQLSREERGSVGALMSRSLTSPALRGLPQMPLSAITTAELVPEEAKISRYNRQRVNTIQGFITPFTLPSVALADFQERFAQAEILLPQGISLEYGGESETQAKAVGNLMSTAGILMVLMVGTVILTFNSFRLAGVVISVAFLSVGLAFVPLYIFDQPRGFMAIVGAMGLIGLAINGAIVVLSALRANPDARAGEPYAIRETVVDCTRHIVGTTMTTIAGFLPLIIWGQNFWKPLSIAIAGGVLGSSVLALIYVPAMFTWIAQVKNRHQQLDADSDSVSPTSFQPAAE